jgi:predicted transcriptional regulator
MQTTNIKSLEGRSVLALLRSVVPDRNLQFAEALRVAELQANRLLESANVDGWPVPTEVVSELPRLRIEQRDLPTSGLSFWDGQAWVIYLDSGEAPTRQRFTLLHEFKHIVDHGRAGQLYAGNHRHTPDEQAEHAADYFAGCVLMPKRLLKRAWGNGHQRPAVLASLFDVSPRAVEVRLAQLGLTEPKRRCAPIAGVRYLPGRAVYFRRSPVNWRPVTPLQGALP